MVFYFLGLIIGEDGFLIKSYSVFWLWLNLSGWRLLIDVLNLVEFLKFDYLVVVEFVFFLFVFDDGFVVVYCLIL